jgi:ElaB/YqjD/DUF883 family membrane-anchored ribosome-binding protein
MSQSNGHTHHMFDDRVQRLEAGVRQLFDRMKSWQSDEDNPVRRAQDRATSLVKAHPIAAATAAIAVGYLVMRLIRR